MKAIYYPVLSRLTFFDVNGAPTGGFIGGIAHRKAMSITASGGILIINTSSKA